MAFQPDYAINSEWSYSLHPETHKKVEQISKCMILTVEQFYIMRPTTNPILPPFSNTITGRELGSEDHSSTSPLTLLLNAASIPHISAMPNFAPHPGAYIAHETKILTEAIWNIEVTRFTVRKPPRRVPAEPIKISSSPRGVWQHSALRSLHDSDSTAKRLHRNPYQRRRRARARRW